ncbi:hypothetical protein PESHB4_01890 [Pediococcus ethanolidurans]
MPKKYSVHRPKQALVHKRKLVQAVNLVAVPAIQKVQQVKLALVINKTIKKSHSIN